MEDPNKKSWNGWHTITALVVIAILCIWGINGCNKSSPAPANSTTNPATAQTNDPSNNADDATAAATAAEQAAATAQASAKAAAISAASCAKCRFVGVGRRGNVRDNKPLNVPNAPAPASQPASANQAAAPPQPPPAAAQPSDDRKYATPEEVRRMLEDQKAAILASIPNNPPAAITVNVPTPVEAPKAPLLTMVCAKPLDQQGNCSKWRKAKIKDWEKQYPAPPSFADLQLLRQANSQHSALFPAWVSAVGNAATGGASIKIAKDGPSDLNVSASASASAVAEALAKQAAAAQAKAAGFGSLKAIRAAAAQ